MSNLRVYGHGVTKTLNSRLILISHAYQHVECKNTAHVCAQPCGKIISQLNYNF